MGDTLFIIGVFAIFAGIVTAIIGISENIVGMFALGVVIIIAGIIACKAGWDY